jgi:hypothetical protein
VTKKYHGFVILLPGGAWCSADRDAERDAVCEL